MTDYIHQTQWPKDFVPFYEKAGQKGEAKVKANTTFPNYMSAQGRHATHSHQESVRHVAGRDEKTRGPLKGNAHLKENATPAKAGLIIKDASHVLDESSQLDRPQIRDKQAPHQSSVRQVKHMLEQQPPLSKPRQYQEEYERYHRGQAEIQMNANFKTGIHKSADPLCEPSILRRKGSHKGKVAERSSKGSLVKSQALTPRSQRRRWPQYDEID